MPRKEVSRSKTKRLASKATASLVLTKLSGLGVAHGHAPYEDHSHEPNKKFDDHSQKLIMMVGVSLIMVIVIVVWILNLKKTIGPNAFFITAENSQSDTDFVKLKNDLQKSISDVKNQINDLGQTAKEATNNSAIITDTIKPTTETIKPTTETIKPITETVKITIPNTLPK